MPQPRVTYNKSRAYSPWRVYFRGKSYWFKTDEEAAKKKKELGTDARARMTPRQVDEYFFVQKILKGVSIVEAARFYAERNSVQLANRVRTVAELAEEYKAQLRGRPKYLQEARRNVNLLVDHCGKIPVSEVSEQAILEFLGRFESAWSHDSALKFAKAFFKWTMSHRVKARPDNPCAGLSTRNPKGTKVYLKLSDAEHVLLTARREFPDLLPVVALQMFAGIRTEEVIRLEWHSIRRGSIRIEPEVGKMGQVKGKQVPRIIDWWPNALEAWMPTEIPAEGKVVNNYRRMKGRLLARCRETKPDFRWGQNAFRHSYGTYGLAFFQSGDRISKLMGERDVDTLHNYYAEYETEQRGQQYFSIGAKAMEPIPIPPNAMKLLQTMMQSIGGGKLGEKPA